MIGRDADADNPGLTTHQSGARQPRSEPLIDLQNGVEEDIGAVFDIARA
jgi:hypothetical protein